MTWTRWGAVLLLASCTPEPGPWVVEHGEVVSRGGAESLVPADAPDPGDAAGEAGGDVPTASPVGAACADGPDCLTGFCMTTLNIGSFIPGALVPGGYCSALFCAIDGSDGACTPGMGGTCFSLFPFLGEAFGDQGICLSPCTVDDDCRTGDDGLCFDAMDLVTQGLIDAGVIDRYYPGGSRGCLPRTVAEAAVRKLSGGDE